MFKATAVIDVATIDMSIKTEEEVNELRKKFCSQMNNGHVVVFGSSLINPSYLHFIDFQFIQDKEVADDTEV